MGGPQKAQPRQTETPDHAFLHRRSSGEDPVITPPAAAVAGPPAAAASGAKPWQFALSIFELRKNRKWNFTIKIKL